MIQQLFGGHRINKIICSKPKAEQFKKASIHTEHIYLYINTFGIFVFLFSALFTFKPFVSPRPHFFTFLFQSVHTDVLFHFF